MHVLVTGGAGFIGSHLVDALIARGDRVTILDSLVARVHPGGRPPDYLPPTARFMRGDVTEPADWRRALADSDAVLHLAAYQDYQPDFSTFARVNDAGTALLFETVVAERLRPRKIVVASSQAVYGEGAYRCAAHGRQHPPPRTLAQLERADWEAACPVCGEAAAPVATAEAHPNPHNAYAISKHAQEQYALVLGRRYDIPTVALRFSIVQGPRQSPANAYSGVLRAFLGRLLNGQRPIVFEDGAQLRDYTHIDDVVAAVLLALDDSRADFEVFNVGSGKPLTVLAYADALSRALDLDLAPEVSRRFRVGDTRHVWSDTAKLHKLGWRPAKSLAEIIPDYLSWLDGAKLDPAWVGNAMDAMERSGSLRRAAGG